MSAEQADDVPQDDIGEPEPEEEAAEPAEEEQQPAEEGAAEAEEAAAADSPTTLAPQEAALFERGTYRSSGMGSSGMGLVDAGMSPDVPGGSSLFDRYASETPLGRRSLSANGATLTSRLRATSTKLACYLNTECNRGRSTIIQLPETCDTLGEVFPLVQRRMGLDKLMLYAAELFLPDGQKITNFKQLHEAASLDTAIIVGCGEPFDPTTVPQSMLSFHMHGGGRGAVKVVKRELADKKLRASQLKADQVRASGHGLSSAAAAAAKTAAVEANRQAAAIMRHDYMNQLIARSSQQTELIRHVQANNAMLRSNRARRDAARKSVWSQDRMQDLAENRRKEANVWRVKQEAAEMVMLKRNDHTKQVRLQNQTGGKLARQGLSEARKAAGLERRMSYISRSVEKAAQEQDIVKAHQEAKQSRANTLRLRSPSASQAGSFSIG